MRDAGVTEETIAAISEARFDDFAEKKWNRDIVTHFTLKSSGAMYRDVDTPRDWDHGRPHTIRFYKSVPEPVSSSRQKDGTNCRFLAQERHRQVAR